MLSASNDGMTPSAYVLIEARILIGFPVLDHTDRSVAVGIVGASVVRPSTQLPSTQNPAGDGRSAHTRVRGPAARSRCSQSRYCTRQGEKLN